VTLRPLQAIALDFGHTVIDERIDILRAAEHEESHLMPGVRQALHQLTLPVAIWANTRVADAENIRHWLRGAALFDLITWVITSVDASARKPAPSFFDYALQVMQMRPDDVLFVGNQRNTDIAGGEAYGIRTVYLSDPVYRSDDDGASDIEPSFTIDTLNDLPALVARLSDPSRPT
jgi:FMN phosphatase YigB (HAD superfamily)